jgi:flagellar basal-body rod modification protein FlgD
MRSEIQSKIKPAEARPGLDISDAKIKNPLNAQDGGEKVNKVSFKDLIMNSNEETFRTREAQKNGDGIKGAKTDEEFAKMMSDSLNKQNLRKPQNNLDKDSFLKLFITQMQNQDPLNPDDSAEMAAQLAQFNGLEQMMNVNKNLEKMQNEQSVNRSITLLPFVGKEVKLSNGKVRIEGGESTKNLVQLKIDAPSVRMEIRDSSGLVVASKDLGSMKHGEHKVEWDGKNAKNEKLADGTYTMQLIGKDLNNQEIPIDVISIVKIKGIDFKEAGGLLETDVGKVRIEEIVSVGVEGALIPNVGSITTKMANSDLQGGVGENKNNPQPSDIDQLNGNSVPPAQLIQQENLEEAKIDKRPPSSSS